MIVLLISVRFHDGRYHGIGDWPPSPARLFQALVAANASAGLTENQRTALSWLEELRQGDIKSDPLIASPVWWPGQRFGSFVPSNDLDSVAGDIKRIGKLRTEPKIIRPVLFDAATPFLYAWTFEANEESDRQARQLCTMAERLYQLGRGVDMAWANGEVIESGELERRLAQFAGPIYRPCTNGSGYTLDCPEPGSLCSLEVRFNAERKRFTGVGEGKKVKLVFARAPKPRFRAVPYESAAALLLFDLRQTSRSTTPFAAWPLARAAELVRIVRGNDGEDDKATSGAFKRLVDALPEQVDCIRRVLIGRGASEADKRLRPRILPLPSIGHVHVARSIRRVLVEVPPNCPLRADDLAWALSGLVIAETLDTDTGELLQTRLVPADDRSMLGHYGVGKAHAALTWRSVTPLALPQAAARRRIQPTRMREEAKDGRERQAEQSRAATAVLQALRHVDVKTVVSSLRLQREPFEAKGARADAFASGTRFAKERLWHVEVVFAQPVCGPLVLGDGRYVGLGLMASVRHVEGVHAFNIVEGLAKSADPDACSRALRRAVMARVQALIGRKADLPTFFSGHAPDGAPLRNGVHGHLAFAADLTRQRLLIIAPHVLEGRSPTRQERTHLLTLDEALEGLAELRAGAEGLLTLDLCSVDADSDPLFAPARRWESVTDYQPTRYAKRTTPEQVLVTDLQAEIQRRGLPVPENIQTIELHEGLRGGVNGLLRVNFAVAVAGPVLVGRSRHFGGGLFAGIG